MTRQEVLNMADRIVRRLERHGGPFFGEELEELAEAQRLVDICQRWDRLTPRERELAVDYGVEV